MKQESKETSTQSTWWHGHMYFTSYAYFTLSESHIDFIRFCLAQMCRAN